MLDVRQHWGFLATNQVDVGRLVKQDRGICVVLCAGKVLAASAAALFASTSMARCGLH